MKKILVVDDAKTIRLIFQKTLAPYDEFHLECSNDGSAAFKYLERSFADNIFFDLIISDWNMPFVSGIELLKRLKADDRFNSIPFIMLTAESASTNIAMAMSGGAIDFIAKPFSKNSVIEKIRKHAT